MASQSEHLWQENQTLQHQLAERDREIADLRERFRHYYKQAEDLSDTACLRCGLDMRNPIHRRKEG